MVKKMRSDAEKYSSTDAFTYVKRAVLHTFQKSPPGSALLISMIKLINTVTGKPHADFRRINTVIRKRAFSVQKEKKNCCLLYSAESKHTCFSTC